MASKVHRCATPDVEGPGDRWETAFVFSFISKFTVLQTKIEGLETVLDFETALLAKEPNPVLTKIMTSFIVAIRPSTRINPDQVPKAVANAVRALLETHGKSQTVYWDDKLEQNVNPFLAMEGGFWTSPWQFKLKLLRQLVEWQLCDNAEVKKKIDRAWNVGTKNKKKELAEMPPPPEDPLSRESLTLVPIGQDLAKKRYWVVDESPRVYTSTNPWKLSSQWEAVSTDLPQYETLIATLKANAPSNDGKLSKLDQGHLALIDFLEERTETVTAEFVKQQKSRRRLEQKAILQAQAEVRVDRPRRQPTRGAAETPAPPSDDEANHSQYEDDGGDDFIDFEDEPSGSRRSTRRSTRKGPNANGKRAAESEEDPFGVWRGERRSTRLGNGPEIEQVDNVSSTRASKRAKTEESVASSNAAEASTSTTNGRATRGSYSAAGAAALKANEIPVDQVAGKKKGKFWFYAVEPVPGPAVNGNGPVHRDQQTNGSGEIKQEEETVKTEENVKQEPNGVHENGKKEENMDIDIPKVEEPDSPRSAYAKSMEGSLSPMAQSP